MYAFRGLTEKYFEVLYGLRQNFFNQGNAHLNYVISFVEREKDNDSWFNHTEVRIDSAVCLQDELGQTSWYILEDKENPDVRHEEINLENPLAQKLLGKVVGNEIIAFLK